MGEEAVVFGEEVWWEGGEGEGVVIKEPVVEVGVPSTLDFCVLVEV